ncbi:MAG: hypothetical protein J6U60_01400, partial [Clostridia bacterium]|nr:hypothetical protein [Clostridia bacterium]
VLSRSEREIVMDIAGAYEENAKGMLVKYVTEESQVCVQYRNLNNQPVRYRFVSEYLPTVTEKGVQIEDMTLISSNGLTATISKKEYVNVQRKVAKAYLIDFDVEATDKDLEFVFSFA